jgi:WD40 repeat protein
MRRFRWMPMSLLVALASSNAAAAPIPVEADAASDCLPAGAIARFGNPRLRPEHTPLTARFSPDSRSLWVATAAPAVEVWNVASGQRRRQIAIAIPDARTRSFAQATAALNPGCDTLALLEHSGTLHAIDPATGVVRCSLPGLLRVPYQTPGLSLSADGKRVAAVDDQFIVVADLAAGETLQKLTREVPQRIGSEGAMLTPDGTRLVVGPGDAWKVLDAVTGRHLRRLPRRIAKTSLMALDNERAFVQASTGVLLSVSLKTGDAAERIATVPERSKVAFSPDGRLVGYHNEYQAGLVATRSGQVLMRLETSLSSSPEELSFSPDGRWLAAISEDGVGVWDTNTARPLYPPGGPLSAIRRIHFLNDGKHLAIATIEDLFVWDVATRRPLYRYRSRWLSPPHLTPTADGKALEGTGAWDTQYHWAIADNGEVACLTREDHGVDEPPPLPGWRWKARQSLRTGELVLVRRDDPTDERVLLAADRFLLLRGYFSPDGRRFAAVEKNDHLHVWACESGRVCLDLSLGGPLDEGLPLDRDTAVAFTQDGRCVLLSREGVRAIEVLSGEPRYIVPGNLARSGRYALSLDGRLLALGRDDGTILLHDAVSGAEFGRFQADHGPVESVAFSPDGRLLVSGGGNGTALLWKVPQRKPPSPLTAAELAKLWETLTTSDAKQAAAAMVRLIDCPDAALTVINEHLKELRRLAPRKRLEALVADLDADTFEVRQKASKELQAAGHAAQDILREALLKSPSPEKQRQLRRLLARLDPSAITPERLQTVRAAEVLERIGSPPARELLAELEKSSADPLIVEEIRDSLQRLQIRLLEGKKVGRVVP